MLGGLMRQSGVIAAAALYALDHNRTGWPRTTPMPATFQGTLISKASRSTCRAWKPTPSLRGQKPGWTGGRVEACKSGVGIGANTATAHPRRHPSDVNRATSTRP
jgi:threonine aldolase